ncbi:GOLPH3/VPS74 family protein [Streptomyces pratensis]|uniref:GOLPH3/VPS74 family protein n=1 Tax=Streptomyces pratensis TaxID=1169025 RepID=UPI003017AEE2
MTRPAPATTLPEEILLLGLDPRRGSALRTRAFLRYATAGAVLAELELQGRVREEGGRVHVVGPLGPADPLLAALLRTLDPPGKSRLRSGTSAKGWVRRHARGAEEGHLDALVQRGVLRRETRRFLGLFPFQRHFPGDPDPVGAARRRFTRAEEQGFPDHRSRVLAALVAAAGLAGALSGRGREGASAMKLLRRAQWTARAVHRNVKQDRSSSGGGGDGGSWSDGGDGSGGGD